MPFAGGQEIGSGYITIGADLTGLRAAQAEAQQIVGQIGQMSAAVGIGGGGSTGTASMPHGIGGTVLGGTFGAGGTTPSFGAPSAGPVLGSGMLTPSFGAPPPNPAQIQASGMSPSFGFLPTASGIPTFSPPLQPTASGIPMGNLSAQMPMDSIEPWRLEAAPGRIGGGEFLSSAISSTAMQQVTEKMAVMSGHLTGRVPLHARPQHLLQQFPWAGGQYPLSSPMGLEAEQSFTRPGPTASQAFASELGSGGGDVLGLASGFIASSPSFGMPFDPTPAEIEGVVGAEAMAMSRAMRGRMSPHSRARGGGGFGPFGAISRALGVPLISIYAANEAARVGLGYMKASELEHDPFRVLSHFDRPGDFLDETADPMMRGFSQGLVSNQATDARWSVWPSFVQIYDKNRQYRVGMERNYEQALQHRDFLLKGSEKANAEIAGLTGGSYAQAIVESNYAVTAAARSASLVGDNGSFQPIADAERMKMQHLGLMRQADIGQMNVHGAAERLLGGAIGSMTIGASGSGRQMLLASSAAEAAEYGAETGRLLTGELDPQRRAALGESRTGEATRMGAERTGKLADFDRQEAQERLKVVTEGNRAVAQAYHNHFGEVMEEFKSFAGQLRNSTRNADQTTKDAVEKTLGQMEWGATHLENERVGEGISMAGAEVTAAGLRIRRRGWLGNIVMQGQAAQIAAAHEPNPQLRQAMLNAAGANIVADAVHHEQELQLEREGLTAQGAAADESMALRPLSSRAVGDVARARREVELATPENRAHAITNMQKVLGAQSFELTAQRGGETAIDMSAARALGNPGLRGLDLTGRLADVQHAQGLFGQGARDLASAKLPTDPGDSLKQVVSLMNQFKTVLDTISQALQAMN